MPQLTKSAFVCPESAASLAELKAAFDEQHVIRLRGFLDPELLSEIRDGVRAASFYDRDHADIAREACMRENATLALLCLAMNDPRLFRFIETLAGCETIRFFNGRVYVMRADAGHFDRWHSDATPGRLIGMSVNLSEGEFAGGEFQLTHVGHEEEAERAIANTGFGDAILFRIRGDLVHRVTAVSGGVPRVAYAGWFQSSPDFLTALKATAANAGDAVGVEVQ